MHLPTSSLVKLNKLNSLSLGAFEIWPCTMFGPAWSSRDLTSEDPALTIIRISRVEGDWRYVGFPLADPFLCQEGIADLFRPLTGIADLTDKPDPLPTTHRNRVSLPTILKTTPAIWPTPLYRQRTAHIKARTYWLKRCCPLDGHASHSYIPTLSRLLSLFLLTCLFNGLVQVATRLFSGLGDPILTSTSRHYV